MIDYCEEIIKELNRKFPISQKAFKIGEAAETGMLYEAGATPAPGLVSPHSSGSHDDMDYFTFLRSTAAITPAMYACAQIGMDYDKEVLMKIRSIGLRAEKEMFRATGGVNTQRGLLFIGGVTAAAAGSCIRKQLKVDRSNISSECRNICCGIVDRELKTLNTDKELSNGEKIFIKYGITGIRGEAEAGLPSVVNKGLPLYETALEAGLSINDALIHSLIGLMMIASDTVVINRRGLEGLSIVQREAGRAMGLGGMTTRGGRDYITYLDKLFTTQGISPGGAADLLAVTVMIHELENMKLDVYGEGEQHE